MPRLTIPGALVVALWGGAASAQSIPYKKGTHGSARAPGPSDGAHLLRDLERLSVVGRVLYVAAHPDDENSRLLAWLVENQKVSAAYLSLTRGEGGQNLIGSEQQPLLGLIRTQELLAARSIDGAQQLFGSERDFGYSKTPEETLSIWGHDAALGDVVWAVRRFQPDVIVTRFSPDDRDTHGHHTASAMLALEAFRAAANPKRYPEQLPYVAPWQARRIVWNKGVFGPVKPGTPTPEGFVSLDVGGYDPLLGDSAGEIAARSRTMHKSQGFGASPQRGPSIEYFRVLDGEPMKQSFLDGVDLTWSRVSNSEKLRALLSQARAQFDVSHPAASIPILLEASEALGALPENPWKQEKLEALTDLIASCAGLYIDALAAEPTAIPGGKVKLSLTTLNRSPADITLSGVLVTARVAGADQIVNHAPEHPASLTINQPIILEDNAELPKGLALSNPHWLDDEPTPGRWLEHDQALVGVPVQPAPLEAHFSLTIAGHALTLSRPVVYAWNDPVMGERRRPLEILPPASINPKEPLLMFPDDAPRELRVSIQATKGPVSGTLHPRAPAGFSLEPASQPFKLSEANAEQVLTFRIHPPPVANEEASITGTLELTGELDGGGTIDRSVVRIDYPHIPIQTLTPKAQVKLVRFSMKRALTQVGYIPGAGDEVPAALRQVGYQVTMLSNQALENEPLDSYQAIVVGVRAFNTNDRMPRYHQKLMDYVSAGGTLVVQYNTQNRISKIAGQIGPWPFNISQDRVTDETAKVTVLEPTHPILKTPNELGDADFANWIQERGIYFADAWDAHYTPIFSMNDPGESAKKGSLLFARSGKGIFIYTGLDFFRELPAGVPGAYRLFANLLSHAQ